MVSKLFIEFILVPAALKTVLSSPLSNLQRRLSNGLALTPPMGQVSPKLHGILFDNMVLAGTLTIITPAHPINL